MLHRPDSRIDQDIEHIHHDIDDDERHGNNQHDTLNEHGVVGLNTGQNGHAHAGQVENDLNNDRAADKVANAKAKNGYRVLRP